MSIPHLTAGHRKKDGCKIKESLSSPRKEVVDVVFKTKTYKMEGIHCGACVEMIKRTLTKVKGVHDMHADFNKKEITLELLKDYDEAVARKSVSELGYKLV